MIVDIEIMASGTRQTEECVTKYEKCIVQDETVRIFRKGVPHHPTFRNTSYTCLIVDDLFWQSFKFQRDFIEYIIANSHRIKEVFIRTSPPISWDHIDTVLLDWLKINHPEVLV